MVNRIVTVLSPPLTPRTGLILIVLIVARISTLKQNERSLDDQIALCRQFIEAHYAGQVQFEVIQSQGSGEFLDRQELFDLEDRIERRQLDLVITEDLGRICRRRHAVYFCEHCKDTLRAPRLIQNRAGPTLTHLNGPFEMVDRLTLAGRAHQFPEAISFSIALSSSASASSFLSRAFSTSSSFNRLLTRREVAKGAAVVFC